MSRVAPVHRNTRRRWVLWGGAVGRRLLGTVRRLLGRIGQPRGSGVVIVPCCPVHRKAAVGGRARRERRLPGVVWQPRGADLIIPGYLARQRVTGRDRARCVSRLLGAVGRPRGAGLIVPEYMARQRVASRAGNSVGRLAAVCQLSHRRAVARARRRALRQFGNLSVVDSDSSIYNHGRSGGQTRT